MSTPDEATETRARAKRVAERLRRAHPEVDWPLVARALLGAEASAEGELAQLREAARALLALHIPYEAYLTWKETGDDAAADALTAYDDARTGLRTAYAAALGEG